MRLTPFLLLSAMGELLSELRAIWSYQESPLFSEAGRAAFDFALAAASVRNQVKSETAAALRAHWDDGEIVEILGVISLFGFLNRWNDSMGTKIEEGAAEAGHRQLGAAGWVPRKHADQ